MTHVKERPSLEPCPFCAAYTVATADSRYYKGRRLRRKKCTTCRKRWSTVEVSLAQAEGMDAVLDHLKLAQESLGLALDGIGALAKPEDEDAVSGDAA